jgi:ABC-type dipeptide/oligopeptide/nickel transport system permease component
MRSSVMDSLNQDYVCTAPANRASERRVLWIVPVLAARQYSNVRTG